MVFWGLGWGGGGVSNIIVIYLGEGRVCFSNGIGGILKIFAYHMKM